jgi:hypothetical protein
LESKKISAQTGRKFEAFSKGLQPSKPGEEGSFEVGPGEAYKPVKSSIIMVDGKPYAVEEAPGRTVKFIPQEKVANSSTDDIKEYEYEVSQFKAGAGKDPGPFGEWLARKPKPGNTINVDVGKKGMVELSEKMSASLVEEHKQVRGMVGGLRNIAEARKLIDSGIITGTGAEFLTGFGNVLSERLGVKFANDPVANTQAYQAMMGKQVAEQIKQFGSGTGLSDADREYAEKIAGGKITVTKESLKKILNINEIAYKNTIKDFNVRAEQAMKQPGGNQLPYDLRVQIPNIEKPAETTKQLTEKDIQFYMKEWGKTRQEVLEAYKRKYGGK